MAVEHGHVQLCGHINVTPLIDVLLVMLIVFMVIAPTKSHGLDAALPQRSVIPNPSPDTPLVVQVTSDRDRRLSYKINQENVGIHDLGSRLSVILSVRADKTMCIEADDNLDFATVVRVMDIGKGAGAEHLGLIRSKDRL